MIFSFAPVSSKNDACFKSSQRWQKKTSCFVNLILWHTLYVTNIGDICILRAKAHSISVFISEVESR